MPAGPFVGIAYGFIWVAILAYVVFVARGVGRVRGELDDVRRKLDAARQALMLSALAIGTPPSSHFIYIPVIFVLGIVLGFIFGSNATRDAIAFEEKKAQEREARKATRQAERAARDAAGGDKPGA